MSEVKIDINTILTKKKVKLVPIVRNNMYMGQKDHDGKFMLTGADMSTDLPIDIDKKQFKQILNKDEQTAFEQYLTLKPGEMSFYNRNSPYWTNYRVKINKEGREFDLSNVKDNLDLRVFKAQKWVAPSYAERFDDAAYKFAIEEEETVIADKLKKSDKNKEAYKQYGKIEEFPSKLKNVLRVYGKTGITNNAGLNFLQSEVSTIIETDVEGFLSIVLDKNFETKIFIQDALDCKAIEKSGRLGYKFKGTDDVEKFASTLEDAIEFFTDAKNQDLFLKVKAQIDNTK